MSVSKAPYHLFRMKQKYQLLRGTEILLWSIAIGLVSFYVLKVFLVQDVLRLTLALLLGLVAAAFGSRKLRLFNIKEKDLVRYLNRHYAQLEESADLLLENNQPLTSLQQLQKLKTIEQFEALYPTIKLPHQIGKAMVVFSASLIICTGLTAFSIQPKEKSLSPATTEKDDLSDKNNLPSFIKNATITISPPAYTGLKKETSSDFNIKIPEGSTVQWKIIFDGQAVDSKFIFSGRDSVRLTDSKNEYHITRAFKESGFYQIAWTSSEGSKQYSDYYKIEVVRDYPPTIAVENLNQFIELKLTDDLKVELKSTLADDYGLSNGHIIATVSKGSGEAIKFREEKLKFDKPKKIHGKVIQSNRTIDLVKLGLQPGDELYFYIEAFDTKTPSPNQTRTETYFITLQDTSTLTTSADAGLGVDLMPEYFRSQRQIIIDSEKLLKEKGRITKQNFNERSNELGYDQKVLRLRYGEFLGEEFASGIGPQHEGHDSEDNHEDEDVEKKFGHVHDKDNEHNLVEEKKPSVKDHAHKEPAIGNKEEDPTKAYVHAHDSDEEATFFIQSIKAKLKAAVTIMWDAELYLRLYQPEKSLPFQYKALKLLKEISQDSRIYVHRTGFDPPPLKEEKRLTGDLSEIFNSTLNDRAKNSEQYPQIRNSIVIIEKLLQEDSIVFSTYTKDILRKAGQEIAVVAMKQPARYLKTLSLLKAVTQDEVPPNKRKNVLMEIRAAFWNVLPQKTMSPQAKSDTKHSLDLRFLRSVEAPKQNH